MTRKCQRCRTRHDSTYSNCDKCRAYLREWRRRKLAERRAAGLCPGGGGKRGELAYCEQCREDFAARKAAYIAAGCCSNCGKPLGERSGPAMRPVFRPAQRAAEAAATAPGAVRESPRDVRTVAAAQAAGGGGVGGRAIR